MYIFCFNINHFVMVSLVGKMMLSSKKPYFLIPEACEYIYMYMYMCIAMEQGRIQVADGIEVACHLTLK